MDIAADETEEAQQFRLEVLKTLSTLPIPNKTMLMDSKVFSVVQKWSEERYLSPRRESPEDEQTSKSTTPLKIEEIDSNCDSNEKSSTEQRSEASAAGSSEKEASEEMKREVSDQALIPELSTNLLNEWANLKEVFRIPKKERIEQMKEHEREAGMKFLVVDDLIIEKVSVRMKCSLFYCLACRSYMHVLDYHIIFSLIIDRSNLCILNIWKKNCRSRIQRRFGEGRHT